MTQTNFNAAEVRDEEYQAYIHCDDEEFNLYRPVTICSPCLMVVHYR